MCLQRRLPLASWLVSQPVCDWPGRGPGRPERLAVSARTADPTERSQLFPRFVQMCKGYAGYEHKTSRQIPLVVLTPEDRPNMT